MWTSETSLPAIVEPEAVWVRWTDPTLWPQDDPDTAAAALDGPVRAGTTGWVKPRRGPRARTTVVRAERPWRFDLETRFPGAVMSFEHDQHTTADGHTVLTHRVTFRGPLSGLWGRLAGAPIARGFPAVMRSIVEHAGGVLA